MSLNSETSSPAVVHNLSRSVTGSDHAQGAEDAPITLVEYGAYECPHCVEAHGIVRQIQAQFGEKRLRFVFRHFPRTNVHPHAEAAAEIAEAAGEQGKFWEMHETLFAHFDRLDGDHLISYAEDLGLDMEQFNLTIDSRKFSAKVREDLTSGIESGVKGTPTFFINGKKHERAYDLKTLLAAISVA